MKSCMAHRGWSGKAPENTMAAVKMALDAPNVNTIEIDIQLSKDGVPILFHDFTLERTTNGYGLVHEHNFEQLLQLDAGSWFSAKYSNEKIPTLEEVLVEVKNRCKLNIELKTAANLHPYIERKVVDLIQQYGMESSVMITSFEHEVIKNIKELDPSIKTGIIIWGKPTLLEEQLRETGATVLSIGYHYLTAEFVSSFMKKGISFVAWTVDDHDAIKAVQQIHEDIAICTNFPDRVV
jgi:glycerophosphoryl diester phosphodiesterase